MSARLVGVTEAVAAVVVLAVAGCGGGGGGGGPTGVSARGDGKIAVAAQSLRLVDDSDHASGRQVATPACLVAPGETFAYTVSVSERSGAAGAAVHLAFDKSVFACDEVKPGDWVAPSAQTAQHVSSAGGGASFASAGVQPAPAGQGILVTFRLRALPQAKPQNAAIRVSGVLADAKGATIGRFASGTSAPRVGVSQASGFVGDLLGTGLPEVGSAIKILRVVVGLDTQPATLDLPKWDCNSSGGVDVGDAIRILRCVVGLDTWPIRVLNTSTFNVTWAPTTTVIDEAHASLLKSADNTNHRYTLDAAGVASAGLNLSPGRFIVIHGVAVRQIASLTPSGSNVIVDTDYAALTDVIQDGTISWDRQVRFRPADIRTAQVGPKQVTIDGNKISVKFSSGAYSYTINITLNDTSAACDISVEKTYGGSVKGRFTVAGQIQGFQSKDTIVIQGHQATSMQHSLNKMTGDLTLGLTVAASGSDSLAFELPVVLFEIPFLIGPLPVELKVKVQFVINASVPLDGSSQVEAKFKYDSDVGISYAGTSVQASANVGPFTIDKTKASTGASGAIGVNFGIGFPRVELDIAGETLSGWAQTAFLIGGDFTFTPPCQQARASFIGAVGYDLGFLGIPILSGSKKLWQEDKVLLKSGECPASAPAVRTRSVLEPLWAGIG